jgi:hypothetical protein
MQVVEESLEFCTLIDTQRFNLARSSRACIHLRAPVATISALMERGPLVRVVCLGFGEICARSPNH